MALNTNNFNAQSLQYGYSTTTTNKSGKTTINAPVANISGISTYTTTSAGTTAFKPTENLTGYPVFSSGKSSDTFSNLDSTAILQNTRYGQTLQASGNATGWPVLFSQQGMDGSNTYEFVIPGYTPAGSITYDEQGRPSFSQKPAPLVPLDTQSATIEPPAPKPPQAPSMASYTSSLNPSLAQQAKLDTKRRRTAQTKSATFLGDNSTDLFG